MTVTCVWRGRFGNTEVNHLHAECFDHRALDDDWVARVQRHSLGWVCARDEDFDDELRPFYASCGFTPTNADLIPLVVAPPRTAR